jgi:hypothetical protein
MHIPSFPRPTSTEKQLSRYQYPYRALSPHREREGSTHRLPFSCHRHSNRVRAHAT